MRVAIPAPPYAPFAGFRAPSNALPVAAAGLAVASFGLWYASSRGAGRHGRRGVAIAAGAVALLLLERWLSGRRRPVTARAEPEIALEETFPASDPIAVHIE